MTDIQQTTDAINWEVDKKKLPEMLNVLTILTFIASGIQAIYAIWGVIKPPPSESELQNMQDKIDQAPDLVKNFTGSHAVEIIRKTMENRIPLMVINLAAAALCIYGALEMRRLKKQGYYFYLIGELVLPVIAMVVLIGLSLYGSFTLVSSLFIPVLFLILYATQLKHLS